MRIVAALISIIIIWSTTPLAIQWSSDRLGFVLAALGRMCVGTLVCLVVLLLTRQRLPLHKEALRLYVAGALGVYGAMISVYWGAQYIPSGLVSVIYGLSPVITGLLAFVMLQEAVFTPGKILGMFLGLAGLTVIFLLDVNGAAIAWQGVVGVLLSVIFHGTSTVWVKRTGVTLPALQTTTGALLISLPAYFVTWVLLGAQLPEHYPARAVLSVLYLGLLGTVVGFTLYYYVLKQVKASSIALLTLITPVSALMVGAIFNGEQITAQIWLGTGLILAALFLHQFGDRFIQGLWLLPQWVGICRRDGGV